MSYQWTCPSFECPGVCQTYEANTSAGLEEWVEFHEEAWHGIPAQRAAS